MAIGHLQVNLKIVVRGSTIATVHMELLRVHSCEWQVILENSPEKSNLFNSPQPHTFVEHKQKPDRFDLFLQIQNCVKTNCLMG